MTKGFANEGDGGDQYHEDDQEDHPRDRCQTVSWACAGSVLVGLRWLVEVIAHTVSFGGTDIAVWWRRGDHLLLTSLSRGGETFYEVGVVETSERTIAVKSAERSCQL